MTPQERAEIQGLLGRLADGDRTAIAPSFEALWPLVRSFSARALGNDADAEDAAQETLAKLFAQVSDLDPSKDGVAWTLTIASWEIRTLRRRRQRKREVSDAGLEIVETGTPESLTIERDLESAAREALRDLAEEDARTILAALADDRPASATFRKRLQRALARLRVAWRAKHETQ